MRKEMLKDGDKTSRGWRLEERMRQLKGGKGGGLRGCDWGRWRVVDGPREEASSEALPALAPGQRRGRDKRWEGALNRGQMWPM